MAALLKYVAASRVAPSQDIPKGIACATCWVDDLVSSPRIGPFPYVGRCLSRKWKHAQVVCTAAHGLTALAHRIPAIVDRENGISLMESGAVLIYLADKTGKLLPKSGEGHYRVLEWLMWQMGGPGPMFGQVHHFVKYNKGKAPYAEERYLKEAHRLYSVLDRRLAQHEFVADDYSIADIAIWPWVSRYEWQTVDLNAYANVKLRRL